MMLPWFSVPSHQRPRFETKGQPQTLSKGLLYNWIVSLKITGNSQERLNPSKFNLSPALLTEVKLAGRSGPKLGTDDASSFLNKGIYKASGKSANIVSANTDLAVHLLGKDTIKAVETFYRNKSKELQRKDNKLSDKEALEKAKKIKTIPERYYRERMTENQGILVIYLFDSNYAFNQKGRNLKEDLKQRFQEYIEVEKIDLSIPLIGYALGFPPIENDPGGIYMKGDYELDLEDVDEEGLPEDLIIS